MLPLVMYSYLSFHYASFSSLSIFSFRIYDVLQFCFRQAPDVVFSTAATTVKPEDAFDKNRVKYCSRQPGLCNILLKRDGPV
jgi:hypothetical protein